VGIRCADHVTPLYPQKLVLTSPTGGGRSVGIVRSRTKATEFSLVFFSKFKRVVELHLALNEFHICGSVHHQSVILMYQLDATLGSLIYSLLRFTLHVLGAFCTHHQEFN
jgi:hypothetical protein